ncbi:MAG: VPS9 domain-containing protein [archaeon]|nr:VPS9 domain-containing protein [archaeon]
MENIDRKSSFESNPTNAQESTKDHIFNSGGKKLNTEELSLTSNPFKTDSILLNSNSLLPFVAINIDITLNTTQLFSKIKEILTKLGAEIFDIKGETFFKIKKKEGGYFRTICSIFFQKAEEIIIQCNIRETSGRYDRIIELKAQKGEQILSENLISNFIKNLIPESKKIKIVKKASGFFNKLQREIDILFKKQNALLMKPLSKKKGEEETMADFVNKEASNYYEIYKIISQENYELGKSISIFINEFKMQNEKVETSSFLLPEQMKLTIMLIKSSADSLGNYFNFGKSNTENMLKYSKPACEKFIFNKIYFILFELYNHKYQSENDKLKSKIKSISEKMTIEEIMTFAEIKEKHRCLDNYIKNNKSPNYLPFKSTIDCINKIEYEQSPKDKINTLLSSGLDIRNTLLGNGIKSEINSMDDELPIYIYISTQLSLKNPVAEFHMIEDYLQFCDWEDKENKVLTNLMSSQLFIMDWNN